MPFLEETGVVPTERYAHQPEMMELRWRLNYLQINYLQNQGCQRALRPPPRDHPTGLLAPPRGQFRVCQGSSWVDAVCGL